MKEKNEAEAKNPQNGMKRTEGKSKGKLKKRRKGRRRRKKKNILRKIEQGGKMSKLATEDFERQVKRFLYSSQRRRYS